MEEREEREEKLGIDSDFKFQPDVQCSRIECCDRVKAHAVVLSNPPLE
jgi:hypothetical protein